MSANIVEVDNWCNTKVQKTKFTYQWIIDNFTDLNFITTGHQHDNREVTMIDSSYFPDSPGMKQMKWQMKLCSSFEPFPNMSSHLNFQSRNQLGAQTPNDSISLFLVLLSCDMTSNCTFNIKLTVKNVKEERVNERKAKMKYNNGDSFPKKGCIPNFTSISALKANNCLPNNQLTIYCEINWVNILNITPKCKPFVQTSLSSKLGDLFNNQSFSDVVLLVDGKEFKAHKAILAMHSDVFQRMFDTQMMEQQENKAVIEDVDADVFEKMLKFMYTDKVDLLEGIADKLLYVADRYNLENLKTICENVLCKSINVDNSADLYVLAYLHSSEYLKQNIIEFISMDPKTLLNTEKWKEVEKERPAVVNEIYRSFTLGTQLKRGRMQ